MTAWLWIREEDVDDKGKREGTKGEDGEIACYFTNRGPPEVVWWLQQTPARTSLLFIDPLSGQIQLKLFQNALLPCLER